MSPRPSLILASASPARLSWLRAAGLAPEVMVSGVAEDGVGGLPAAEAVRTLAERKAAAVASRLADTSVYETSLPGAPAAGAPGVGPGFGPGADLPPPTTVVLGCDSLLGVGGEVRGKPSSPDQARRWWRDLRGATGTLYTGHALIEPGTWRRTSGTAAALVRFGTPTDAEIDAYVASGEPLQVAGAFTLDGRGAPFVDGIDGDPGTVVGVSLPLLRRLLAELGVAITDLWESAP